MLFQVSFFSQGGPNIGPIVSGQIGPLFCADGDLNLTHGSCSGNVAQSTARAGAAGGAGRAGAPQCRQQAADEAVNRRGER